jgi:hypothetical protein
MLEPEAERPVETRGGRLAEPLDRADEARQPAGLTRLLALPEHAADRS